MFEQTGLPVSAHNRYWASNTDYAKKNGGKYNFVVEEYKSIPQDWVIIWPHIMILYCIKLFIICLNFIDFLGGFPFRREEMGINILRAGLVG